MANGPTYTRRQCQLIDALFRMVWSGLTLVEEDFEWAARLSPGRIPPATLEQLEQMRKRVVLFRLVAELIATARWSPEPPLSAGGTSGDAQPRYSKRFPIFDATQSRHPAPEEERSRTSALVLELGGD